METAKAKPFDPAEYLEPPEAFATCMTEALDTGDPAFVADALGITARAHNIDSILTSSPYRSRRYRTVPGSSPSPTSPIPHRCITLIDSGTCTYAWALTDLTPSSPSSHSTSLCAAAVAYPRR